MEIETPRDREDTCEPQTVRRRQRRLNGVEETVLSLSAKGRDHGEISAHLAEVYGANLFKQTISTVTWRDHRAANRRAEPPTGHAVYSVIFLTPSA